MKHLRILLMLFLSIVGLLIATDSVLAQPKSDSGKKEPRKERGSEDRPARRDRGKGRYKSPAQRMKMIEAKIELDDQQREQIEDVLRTGQARIKQVRKEMGMTEEEKEEMRSLRQQWRDAQDSGNQDLIEEAREARERFMRRRMDRVDEIRIKTLEQEETMRDGIRKQLREDQIEQFDAVWAEIVDYPGRFGPRDRNARNARDMDARRMRRIVDGLEGLTPAQKKDIDNIFSAHREKERTKRRERRKRDPEAERTEGSEGRKGRRPKPDSGDVDALANAVIKVLNEAQAAEFQKELDKAKAQRSRRDGKRGRGKRGPGEKRPPPPSERE